MKIAWYFGKMGVNFKPFSSLQPKQVRTHGMFSETAQRTAQGTREDRREVAEFEALSCVALAAARLAFDALQRLRQHVVVQAGLREGRRGAWRGKDARGGGGQKTGGQYKSESG